MRNYFKLTVLIFTGIKIKIKLNWINYLELTNVLKMDSSFWKNVRNVIFNSLTRVKLQMWSIRTTL